MMEIKTALDAAFAAYADALSKGAPEELALNVGLARYRVFFPDTVTSVFEVAIQAAREMSAREGANDRVLKQVVCRIWPRCQYPRIGAKLRQKINHALLEICVAGHRHKNGGARSTFLTRW